MTNKKRRKTDRSRRTREPDRQRSFFLRWLFAGLAAVLAIVIVATQTDRSFTSSSHHLESANRNLQFRTMPTRPGPSWNEIDNPRIDGWDTEAFHQKAKKQLEALGKLLSHANDPDVDALAKLLAVDFKCTELRPSDLETAFEDDCFTVLRCKTDVINGNRGTPQSRTFTGPEGFAKAIAAATARFSDAEDVRFEFKIFRVTVDDDDVATRQYFSISGRVGDDRTQQNATWLIHWLPGAAGEVPVIKSIDVVRFEEARSHMAGRSLFSDCTASVLGNTNSYKRQLLRGMNHWFDRIQDSSYFSLLGNPGIAIGDVNGDSLEDIYVCQEAGLPNRLYIQNSDGTARDESDAWGVDWLESSRSALFVDLDNDGDQDLVVAIRGGLVVAENIGNSKLQLRDVLETADDTMSLSAVDYDTDGRLDLYVCAYYRDRSLDNVESGALSGGGAGFVFHDANNGGNNTLFRNRISADGNWQFVDVTATVGLDANNHRYSLAATWDDFDNDGDLDLYVANDFGRDNLYRNQTSNDGNIQFLEVSDSANVESAASGMSASCGDYDRDGWIDVFISNMFSSAGNRIAFQQRFQPDAPEEVRHRYQRLARGNTLLRNTGDGTFKDRSAATGIEMGRWAWGSRFIDVNNDGWQDMVVSNGYITTEDSGDL